MKTGNTKLINVAILVSLGLMTVGFWTDITELEPIGLLALGFMLVVFHREIGAEQLRLYNASKTKFSQTSTSAYPTAERNSMIVLIVGIGFLIGGALTAAVVFL